MKNPNRCVAHSRLLLVWLLASYTATEHDLILASAFKYKLTREELTAPEMICFSGLPVGSDGKIGSSKRRRYSLSSNTCPDFNSREALESYKAIVLDEAGHIQVKLSDVVMLAVKEEEIMGKENLQRVASTNVKAEQGSNAMHRLQMFLVSLDELIENFDNHDNFSNQCCYEVESQALVGTPNATVPEYCTPSTCEILSRNVVVHNYRMKAPRLTGPTGSISPPIPVYVDGASDLHSTQGNATESEGRRGVDIMVRLKPQRHGRHVVIVSNCASEIVIQSAPLGTTVTPLKAIIEEIEVHFVFRFGELPLSLMGIIPFYGILATCYTIMSIVWSMRSSGRPTNFCLMLMQQPWHSGRAKGENRKLYWKNRRSGTDMLFPSSSATSPVLLLGLQRALRSLLFAQTVYCAIAFLYYLRLNWTAEAVDINVLYSGTAAALVNFWDPFSAVLALCHFGTILSCQCVVTLATDGTWLIQHNIRTHTKRVLFALCALWVVFFILYGFLSKQQRTKAFAVFLACWVLCLLYNIHASLRHLKTVMIGQSNDQILAVGGAVVAKRSMYRKMYCVVLMYPIIFVASFVWTSCVSDL